MFGGITYNSFDDYQSIKKNVISRLENTGFCALVSHCTLLKKNPEYRALYHNLLSELSKLDEVVFVTASEYYMLLKNKEN